MRFIYEEHSDYTSFTAIPENDKERYGLRAQGPYTALTMTQDTLIVKYVSKKMLHPDIVAAICITAFYPFIHSSATMPFPVSKRFADGLQMDILPQHGKIDGVYRATEPITIENIDVNLEPYVDGTNTVVAYGGGMDSTAIACLFPEYALIHSTDIDNKDDTVRKFVEDNLKNKIHIIESNCKYLATPKGFTTFTNIYITPLIMTADLDIKNIMCGAILGATCLSNGTKYFPQFDPSRRNRWERFYNHIGLCMFSPIAGCSELITSKIICEHNLEEKVIYCDINKGFPCNKCTKCLRKQLELAYHGAYAQFDLYEPHFITQFLKRRPLYFGHIYMETIHTLSRRLHMSSDSLELCKSNKKLSAFIQTLEDAIPDLRDVETKLFTKIYAKSFKYFPQDIQNIIVDRLLCYADVMSNEEEHILEKWDMTIQPKLKEPVIETAIQGLFIKNEPIVVIASKEETEYVSKEELESVSKDETESASKEETESVSKDELESVSKEELESVSKDELESVSKEETESVSKDEPSLDITHATRRDINSVPIGEYNNMLSELIILREENTRLNTNITKLREYLLHALEM